jgi:hypothetical protein
VGLIVLSAVRRSESTRDDRVLSISVYAKSGPPREPLFFSQICDIARAKRQSATAGRLNWPKNADFNPDLRRDRHLRGVMRAQVAC